MSEATPERVCGPCFKLVESGTADAIEGGAEIDEERAAAAGRVVLHCGTILGLDDESSLQVRCAGILSAFLRIDARLPAPLFADLAAQWPRVSERAVLIARRKTGGEDRLRDPMQVQHT